MVYKKYIRKNGKLYGPYYYHSKRVDGKVISEYHGSERENLSQEKSNFSSNRLKKTLFVLLGVLFLFGGIYLFMNYNPNFSPLTGFATLDLNANYISGENLEGSLSLVLNEGELLPASSQIVFETENEVYNYSLQEIVSDEKIVGNFYVAGGNISGEGIGYGLEGRKIIYPEVSFVLLISEKISSEESLEREIEGIVSKEKDFLYELKENESAEIRYLSVKDSLGENLPDEILVLDIINRTAVVSTDYFLTELGFGGEYGGEGVKLISIDLSKLNLNLSDSNVKVKLIYSGVNLIDLSVQLQEEIEEEQISEEIISQPEEVDNENTSEEEVSEENNESLIELVNKTLEETLSEEIDSIYELDEEDKNILREHFPNSSIIVTKSVIKNSRIFVRYELGDYWFEATYDINSKEEILQKQMELDRIRWLRDILNNILREENLEEFEASEFLIKYPF
jgi:hypothetical protein